MAQEAIQYEDIIRQDPGFAAAVTEEDGMDEDGKEVYYTGEWLPISNTLGDASEDENTCSYALNIDGEEVRLDYMMSVYWEKDVGDCARIAHHTYTVRMPADYDGLVFCASPSPYTYEECMASDREGEGYFTGLTLEERIGIDEDNALFCRIR